MYYQELLDELTDACKTEIKNQLSGIYLHGSMVMGCFNPVKSDIDIIVVIENGITDEQKLNLMTRIVRLNRNAPAKGIEISFVKREYCNPFVYPTPFELHFSPAHLQWFFDDPKDYIDKMNGEDKDLAAHFTIINQYGVTLCGSEIADVFGSVPREDYVDSIWSDIENASEDILENPMYVILNLCRVLAYLVDGAILSKEKGGEWGLAHFARQYQSLIGNALNCYRSNEKMVIDEKMAVRFADTVLAEIHTIKKSTPVFRD